MAHRSRRKFSAGTNPVAAGLIANPPDCSLCLSTRALLSRILGSAAPPRPGSRRLTPAARRVQTQTASASITAPGPTVLDCAPPLVAGRMPCPSSRRTMWCPGIALALGCFSDCAPAPDRSDNDSELAHCISPRILLQFPK